MTGTTGLVVRVDAKCCHVEIGAEVHLCSPRGKLFRRRGPSKNPIAVGDRVSVVLDAEGGAVIEEVLPRRSRLARASAGEGKSEQVLVANLDLCIVVSSLREPAFQPRLVDRILAGAEREDLAACLVLNKVDLAPEDREWADFYGELGYRVIPTSIHTGAGISALRDDLADHISVFCGLSGVGKSSLLNAIEPGLALAVGEVSDTRGEGTHTTTHSSLLSLANGGHVVDTPGVRNFGLFGLEPAEAAGLFREFVDHLGGCRFRDCSHRHEPDCRVLDARAAGEISESRYASYIDLVDACEGGAGGRLA